MARLVRSAALALLVAMTGAGAWLACETPQAPGVTAEVDPGPTFGVELTVAIKGRGRVLSRPSVIDCPSECFARIVLADPTIDGSDVGLSLTAEPTSGAHFAGWSYDLINVGARARGPSQCSPMMRSTSAPPVLADNPRVALHYGETKGTPPPGLEAECADFTNVPVAYALTATFVDDDSGILPERDAGIEQLFEAPMDNVVGRELGVTGGMVYWRFDKNGASGIAAGPNTGGGEAGSSNVVVYPVDTITAFDVGAHVTFQHGPGGTYESIRAGASTRTYLSAFNACVALASTATTAYCRYGNAGSPTTYLYMVPIGGGSLQGVHSLPHGNMLAVDDQRFYFTDDVEGATNIESAPFDGGGSSPVTTLATVQGIPRALSLGPTDLFWIDSQGGTSVTRSLPKGGGDAKPGVVASNARFVVADPTSPTIFWVGLPSTQNDQSSIVRASTSSGSIKALVANLPSLGGIAVDATHVYWTQTDGRVFRAPKP